MNTIDFSDIFHLVDKPADGSKYCPASGRTYYNIETVASTLRKYFPYAIIIPKDKTGSVPEAVSILKESNSYLIGYWTCHFYMDQWAGRDYYQYGLFFSEQDDAVYAKLLIG